MSSGRSAPPRRPFPHVPRSRWCRSPHRLPASCASAGPGCGSGIAHGISPPLPRHAAVPRQDVPPASHLQRACRETPCRRCRPGPSHPTSREKHLQPGLHATRISACPHIRNVQIHHFPDGVNFRMMWLPPGCLHESNWVAGSKRAGFPHRVDSTRPLDRSWSRVS